MTFIPIRKFGNGDLLKSGGEWRVHRGKMCNWGFQVFECGDIVWMKEVGTIPLSMIACYENVCKQRKHGATIVKSVGKNSFPVIVIGEGEAMPAMCGGYHYVQRCIVIIGPVSRRPTSTMAYNNEGTFLAPFYVRLQQ